VKGKKRPADRDHFGDHITRRDFLNTTLLGAGAALLTANAPSVLLGEAQAHSTPQAESKGDAWTGYGGVGDYANANGNTWPVMSAAHKIRDAGYNTLRDVTDTGEDYDVIVVGGGLTGLGAAYFIAKESGGVKKCLVLENHPVFGGECRQNEFIVNGQRLIGPQGSNDFGLPRGGSSVGDQLFTELKIPREFGYQPWDPRLKPLRIPRDNYANMDGINETAVDVGYFFDRQSGAEKPVWLRNIWDSNFEGTPFSEKTKRDLQRWRTEAGKTPENKTQEEFRRYLDGITYKDYLERDMDLSPEVTKFVEPVVGLLNGCSADAHSARAGLIVPERRNDSLGLSFPGGNTTFARYLVRALIPDSLPAGDNFDQMLTGKINFAALDKPSAATRIRLSATVIRVEHERARAANSVVLVTYEKGGKLYRAKARAAIMASGGWITKYILPEIPDDIRNAYNDFLYATDLVVNVALTNWRFLYKLDAPACRWFDGDFGFCCNIRNSMVTDSYNPPLDPDKPIVLTFYMGLYVPGRSAADQGTLSRTKMLATSYAQYEHQIRNHMLRLFGDAGFVPRRDVAGIILNRWGHARIIQTPGFYYGVNGKPAGREIVQKGFGRIAIGHSELNGHQNWTGAVEHGKRTAEQVLALG
jgi:spermidine dehydrogenase